MQLQDESNSAARELETAFLAFNQLSEQLSTSYRALEARITSLNLELAAARSERLEQLAQKEILANRLSQLLGALPAGVVVIDGAGTVQECNRAAVELLGEPLFGEVWRDIITRAFAPGVSAGQEAALRDGRLVSIQTCPLGAEPGQIILLIDVTETRVLQATLERHKRLSAMGEMAAKLAHQVRTPLASALLYASHLLRPRLTDTDRERFADKVMARLRHLEQVVNDMLSFARGGTLSKERIAVSALVHELQQAMEPQLAQALCTLEITNEARQAFLQGNREALLGALQNLASNSIQACGQGGKLRLLARPVRVHRGLPSVDLIFSDNGPGMPSDVKEHVFEPFFTTRPQGTGLGLAIVQAVVQAHGGTIWLESTQGSGATFVLRLPAHHDTAVCDDAIRTDTEQLKRSAL